VFTVQSRDSHRQLRLQTVILERPKNQQFEGFEIKPIPARVPNWDHLKFAQCLVVIEFPAAQILVMTAFVNRCGQQDQTLNVSRLEHVTVCSGSIPRHLPDLVCLPILARIKQFRTLDHLWSHGDERTVSGRRSTLEHTASGRWSTRHPVALERPYQRLLFPLKPEWVRVANVNYAALLVVLVVLTFAFPPLVRLAQAQGIPQSWTLVAASLGAVFVLAWYLVRQRVQRYRDASEKVTTIRAQLEAKPNEPEAYFLEGDHLGDLLMLMNRRHEALEVFEAYLGLEAARGKNLPALEQRISRLKARMNG
jgi:hypothetical protein